MTPSSRICSFHFFGGQRNKSDVSAVTTLGTNSVPKSSRKNPKDKIRQLEKIKPNQTMQMPTNTDRPVTPVPNMSRSSRRGKHRKQTTPEIGPSGDTITNSFTNSEETREALLKRISELEEKNKFLVDQNFKLQSKLFP